MHFVSVWVQDLDHDRLCVVHVHNGLAKAIELHLRERRVCWCCYNSSMTQDTILGVLKSASGLVGFSLEGRSSPVGAYLVPKSTPARQCDGHERSRIYAQWQQPGAGWTSQSASAGLTSDDLTNKYAQGHPWTCSPEASDISCGCSPKPRPTTRTSTKTISPSVERVVFPIDRNDDKAMS